MCRPFRNHQAIVYEHLKVEGVRTIGKILHRIDLITKVDLSDFFMHFLIRKGDAKYMQFMCEGRKYRCTGMPFRLALAPRHAAK